MHQEQADRIEKFLFRALWLIMCGAVRRGLFLSGHEIEKWQNDYREAGGFEVDEPDRS